MKKITTIFIASLILLSSFVYASAKEYDFVDNNIIVILTEAATQKVENNEIVINKDYFTSSEFTVVNVESLSEESRPNIYLITLDKNDCENVLQAINILNAYEEIELAEPNYFSVPAGLNKKSIKLKAGETTELTLQNVQAKKWKSSNKKIATVKSGKVTALKKGNATITATLTNGKKLTCKVKVSSSPTIKINKNKFNKKTTYTIKKGSFLTVKITGKAAGKNNVYASSKKKIAKITTVKKNVSSVKIKGLNKGKSTITLKVNGVAFKIKVKVK